MAFLHHVKTNFQAFEVTLVVVSLVTSATSSSTSAPTTPCVCTSHVETRILPYPSVHAEPIGYLFENDCKLQSLEPLYQHRGFLAIVHYHQIAYVRTDDGTKARNCTTFMIDESDKLTTTVTPPVTRCDKMAAFKDVAMARNIGAGSISQCPGSHNNDADAVIMVYCGAPKASVWRRGLQVFDNCLNLAPFTPVATFGNFGQHLAGILLGCERQSFHIVSHTELLFSSSYSRNYTNKQSIHSLFLCDRVVTNRRGGIFINSKLSFVDLFNSNNKFI